MRPVNPNNAGEEVWTQTLRRLEQVERAGKAALLSSSTGPTANDGSDGDWWLDRNAGRLYGPKGSVTPGQWPSIYFSMEPASAWTSLSLLNGWVNVGGAYPPASYRLAGGRVIFRGQISRATPPALGTAITTLPFAPPYEEAHIVTAGNSAFNAVAFARLHTNSTGLILADGNTTNAATSLSLAGISYSVS